MDSAVDAVRCIIYLNLNLIHVALLPLQAAPLAGGGNREPYRPMTSSCMTLTRTTGTRPGWMPGGDSKTLEGSHCDSRINTVNTIKTLFFFSSSCAGTPAVDDQLQHLGRSLVRLRVYRTATLSSTVPPAWQHSAWTVRGEISVWFVCIWISLSCGLNKTFEDVILSFGKHWVKCFTNFWLFIDQTINVIQLSVKWVSLYLCQRGFLQIQWCKYSSVHSFVKTGLFKVLLSWFHGWQYLRCVHSGMTSTGRSIEPCSSWTARWRETRCCDTKRSRRGNREAGKGGRDRRQTQLCRMRDPTRRRRGWTLMRFTTRFSAPNAPLRWPCSIKMKSTTSSTSSPATAETDKKTLFHFTGLSLILHLTAAPGVFRRKKKKERADSFFSILPEEEEISCGHSECIDHHRVHHTVGHFTRLMRRKASGWWRKVTARHPPVKSKNCLLKTWIWLWKSAVVSVLLLDWEHKSLDFCIWEESWITITHLFLFLPQHITYYHDWKGLLLTFSLWTNIKHL